MTRFCLLVSSACLCAFAAAQSQTLLIPASANTVDDGNSSTSFPWDRDTSRPASNDIRAQYVYGNANFASLTSPIVISTLRFRANETTTSWVGGTYTNVEVRVGAAANDFTSLDNTFANNWPGGVDPAPVYSGPVTVDPGTGNGFNVAGPLYITINLTTPVLFTPSQGDDLCIDIRHDGDTGGAQSFSIQSDVTTINAMCRRVASSSDWLAPSGIASPSSIGLICELGFDPATGTFPSFEQNAQQIGFGQTVQFTDTSFSTVGITSWAWDFDSDGTVDSTVQNPSFQFNGCGAFDVTLTTTDSSGQVVSVTQPGAVEVVAPVADFSFTVSGTTPPFTVQLTDESTLSPSSWSWDFNNDGVVDSNVQNPSFQVMTRGVETVSLTAASACGANTLTRDVDTRLRLCTQFGGLIGWLSGSAFYFDVEVTRPDGLTIEELGVQIVNAGLATTLNVYIKPGTHVGSETVRNAWSLVSTGTNPSSTAAPGETIVDIADFSLAPGTWGVAVEYLLPAANERFNYSSGGPTNASNGDLALSNGGLYFPAFESSTVFEPRNWNGCVYYAFGQTAGSFAVTDLGCMGSNGDSQTIGLDGPVPTIGQNTVIETTGGLANQVSLLNFGVLPQSFDLTIIGAPGCILSVETAASIPALLDAGGRAGLALPIPNTPSLVGAQFFVQPLSLDLPANALGITLGAAGRATIGQ